MKYREMIKKVQDTCGLDEEDSVHNAALGCGAPGILPVLSLGAPHPSAAQ